MMRLILLVLLVTSLATRAEETFPAATQGGSAQRVEETYGDWSRICTTSDENRVCQIVQTANQNESGQLVFQTAVGYVSDNERPIMYLTAPLGIFLPRGISIFVDEEEQGLTATVQRCDQNGCLGVLAMEPALVDKLKKGQAAKMIFGASAQRNVSIPLSLTGFTRAFNSLEGGS